MNGERLRSFAPSHDRRARCLILGSMPGTASLAAAEYYAHPRNAFWWLMEQLFEVPRRWPYERRLAALRRRGVALWDVLHSCRRDGSLDAAIDDRSVAVNDFDALFAACPRLTRVFFNGAKAEQLYRRHVLPAVRERDLDYRRLPSTSPANASWSLPRKLDAWRVLCDV